MSTALVIGAGGAVGEAVAHALLDVGWRVIAGMRRFNGRAAARLIARNVRVIPVDLAAPDSLRPLLGGVEGVVLAPILTVSAPVAGLIAEAGVERAVFFSSNNVAVAQDEPVYAALAAAEREALAALPRATVLRPTLIYGDVRLRAVTRLMRLMRRTPVFPVPGWGKAVQQPVFYQDLARAAATALLLPEAAGKTFAVGGPETMSLRAMYRAVSQAAGGWRLLAPAPAGLLGLAARILPLPLDRAQLRRVDRDKQAVAADPAPPALQARTPLAEGLRRLAGELSS